MDVTGLILAGGRSRRFGQDKACYPLEGRPMIEHVVSAIRPHVGELLVSVRRAGGHAGIAARPLLDQHPGKGPLAGLHAGLAAARTPWLLVVACDMPFLTPVVLATLLAARNMSAEAIVARTPDGRLQPLCAVYRRTILHRVEEALATDALSVQALLARLVSVLTVDVPAEPLLNVNTLQDLPRKAR